MKVGDFFQLKAGDKVDEALLSPSDPCIRKDWVVRNVTKENYHLYDGRETVYSTWVSAVPLDGSIEKPIRFAIMKWVMD